MLYSAVDAKPCVQISIYPGPIALSFAKHAKPGCFGRLDECCWWVLCRPLVNFAHTCLDDTLMYRRNNAGEYFFTIEYLEYNIGESG